jgi:subtilisin family serine protease
VPGTVVVRTDGPAGAAARTAIAEAAGGEPGQVVAPDTFVVHLPADAGPEVLEGVDGVAALQPELVYQAADTEPGDPCWRSSDCVDERGRAAVGGQVELRSVGAPQAWDRSRGSADVVVAVLDTEVETEPPHRDLVGKLLPGASFVADPACGGPATARGHGTIAAGLIAARPDNGTDVAGLGWDTRVLPVEVLDDCGAGTTSGVAAGVRWAADAGADILNLSLTGGGRDPALSSAVAYARSKGAIVVAAAGNQGGTREVFPAADLGVVAVAATGVAGSPGGDGIAPFSNRGRWVDIAAPGTDVVGLRREGGSTTPYDGTTRATGTSFASPLVAATAALVMAQDPTLTPEQVVARLAQTAAPVPGTGEQLLWGRLDAAAALGPLPVGYRLAAADGGCSASATPPSPGRRPGPPRSPSSAPPAT